MFTQSCKDLNDVDWNMCASPSTAVELHVKISKAHMKLFQNERERLYRAHKEVVYKSISAKSNINVGVFHEKRNHKND